MFKPRSVIFTTNGTFRDSFKFFCLYCRCILNLYLCCGFVGASSFSHPDKKKVADKCPLRRPCFPFLQELNAIFEKIDTDQSGLIDFDEFVTGVAKFVLEKSPTNGASR